jgi:hypothetical protein
MNHIYELYAPLYSFFRFISAFALSKREHQVHFISTQLLFRSCTISLTLMTRYESVFGNSVLWIVRSERW